VNVSAHWMEVAIPLGPTRPGHGLKRGEHGRVAGLRTASIAMIRVNFFYPCLSDSFFRMDLVRLTQGILTGAVLRRDAAVFGVTTAATPWRVRPSGVAWEGGRLVVSDHPATITGT
jgi:uncharacterized membrane protein YhiD involved in acid resistance